MLGAQMEEYLYVWKTRMQNVRQSYQQKADNVLGNIAMQNETIYVVLFCASFIAGF
jgi:hypothetical protein